MQIGQPNAGGMTDRIGNSGGNIHHAALTNTLGAERASRLMGFYDNRDNSGTSQTLNSR